MIQISSNALAFFQKNIRSRVHLNSSFRFCFFCFFFPPTTKEEIGEREKTNEIVFFFPLCFFQRTNTNYFPCVCSLRQRKEEKQQKFAPHMDLLSRFKFIVTRFDIELQINRTPVACNFNPDHEIKKRTIILTCSWSGYKISFGGFRVTRNFITSFVNFHIL